MTASLAILALVMATLGGGALAKPCLNATCPQQKATHYCVYIFTQQRIAAPKSYRQCAMRGVPSAEVLANLTLNILSLRKLLPVLGS